MSFLTRLVVGAGLGTVGMLFGGPVGAYAGWKGGGFLATGNPLHLIPGAGGFADGMDIAAGLGSDSLTDFADGNDVHGNDRTNDGWGNHPSDGQGNDPRNNGWGNRPTDVWGNPL